MELNLLFLPLLGGYVFYTRWHVTSFYAARCSAQRLLFHAAAFGLLLLVVAPAMVMATEAARQSQAFAVRLTVYLSLSSVAVVMIALAWIYHQSRIDVALRNELGSCKTHAGALIAASAAALSLLLFRQVPGDRIELALRVVAFASCSWIAVGACAAIVRYGMGELDAFLQVLPVMSGYRDQATRKIVFTTYYDEIYEAEDVVVDDFMKVLPLANIDSAGKFREDVYLHFLQSDSENVEPPVTREDPPTGHLGPAAGSPPPAGS